MWAKKYNFKNTYIGRLDHDADLLEEVNNFCNENNITCGYVTIIGALKKATMGFYNQETRKYKSFSIDQEVEIVSCYGNISIKDDKSFAHIHLVVSDDIGNCIAGHTMPGCIVFAGEIFIYEMDSNELVRQFDEVTGLPLWNKPA